MKICFYARAGQTALFSKMAIYLKRENIDSIFITQNNDESSIIRKLLPDSIIYNLTEFLEQNWAEFTKEKLNKIMNEFASDKLWEMFYGDRFLVKYSYDDAIKFLIGHLEFYNMVFSIETPDLFFNEAIAIYSSYAAYFVGKKYNIPYYGFIIARDAAKSKFFFIKDPFQTNYRMKELYTSNITFSNEDIKAAEQYINDFTHNSNVPSYMEKHLLRPRFRIKYLTYLPLTLLSFCRKKYHNKYNYELYKEYAGRLQVIKQYFTYLRSKKYYKQPVDDEKFYLFPLHLQPEASTLICANKYEKQLFAIDNIAKVIPADCVLYVKEHYACVGHRNKKFYIDLKLYPNVRLIDPYYPIKELIKKSKAVIVLTSTTGFEALLLKKPVYVLGNVFYDFFQDIQKLKDVYNEREKLHKPKDIDNDNLLRFICAYQKSLYNGCVYYGMEEFSKNSNIENICISLMQELGYINQ